MAVGAERHKIAGRIKAVPLTKFGDGCEVVNFDESRSGRAINAAEIRSTRLAHISVYRERRRPVPPVPFIPVHFDPLLGTFRKASLKIL
jgi:hypothetical protein